MTLGLELEKPSLCSTFHSAPQPLYLSSSSSQKHTLGSCFHLEIGVQSVGQWKQLPGVSFWRDWLERWDSHHNPNRLSNIGCGGQPAAGEQSLSDNICFPCIALMLVPESWIGLHPQVQSATRGWLFFSQNAVAFDLKTAALEDVDVDSLTIYTFFFWFMFGRKSRAQTPLLNWRIGIEFSPSSLPLSLVYPSLESDEDDPALKSLPKKKKCTDDAPWSPKGKNLYTEMCAHSSTLPKIA